MKNTLVSNNINWKNVPGYKTILKAVLLEMKDREIQNYPEALKEGTCALLANEKLLNVFTYIVFLKTHAFDTQAVSGALELAASWFTTISKNKAIIPPQFDFTFFFKGINILMSLDHGVSTAKCVWLLYRILHIIPLQQRAKILKKVLKSSNFYDLALHWSWNVRYLFCYFYFFQLYHSLNKDKITYIPTIDAAKSVQMDRYFGLKPNQSSVFTDVNFDFKDDDPATKLSKLRQMVQSKNAKGSMMVQKSRLYTGENIQKL